MQNDWNAVVNIYLSGEISKAQAIQMLGMLGEEYDSFDANEDRARESLGKFLFEGDDKALLEAQRFSMKLLINSIQRGSIYHDNVIGLSDVIALVLYDYRCKETCNDLQSSRL